MNVLCIDFETRSKAALKTTQAEAGLGGRRYAEHPTTEPLCCVMKSIDRAQAGEWMRGDTAPRRDWIESFDALAAHNAMGFDVHVWRVLGWPEPRRWIDTSQVARRAGLPGGLDKLAQFFGLDVQKDKEGSRITRGLSLIKRPPDCPADFWRTMPPAEKRQWGVLPPLTPEVLARVVAYCAIDVDVMIELWPYLEPWIDAEPDVERVDRIINDRGVGFDAELARALLECDARRGREACEAAGVTPALVQSPAALVAEFQRRGALVPNAQYETIAELLDDEAESVRLLAEARLGVASIARGKLRAGLARVSPDGRLRDSFKYLGAHTWRWAGQGFQTQNIPWIDKTKK